MGGTAVGTAQRGTHRDGKDSLRLGAGLGTMLGVAGAGLVPQDFVPCPETLSAWHGVSSSEGWGPFSTGSTSY